MSTPSTDPDKVGQPSVDSLSIPNESVEFKGCPTLSKSIEPEIPQPPAPTKEQLKRMAGAQGLRPEPTPQPGSQADGGNDTKSGTSNIKSSQNLLRPGELDLKQLRSVRPVSARAVPKALFTALLISPIFLVAFVFVRGIKVPKNPPLVAANQSKAQAVEPEDATDEVTELRRQLAQANAQLALSQRENEQASAALPQPAQKESKNVVRTRPTPTRVVARRTVAPVPLVQPLRPAPRVQPQMIVKPIPAPKTAEPVDPNQHLRQLASADIYGSAVLEKSLLEEENTTSSPLATTKTETKQLSSTAGTEMQNALHYPAIQGTEMASSPEAVFRQSALQQEQNDFPLQPNFELEAPLLNGQPQHFLKAGTAALAVLATPLFLVQEQSGDKQEDVTIVLSEPLTAADHTEVFPVGTQIVAQMRSLSEDGMAKLVGVFVLVEKGNAVEKIALPDSAIQILTPEGEPLALRDEPSERQQQPRRSLLGSVARRAASSAAIRNAFGGGSSDLVSGLAEEAASSAADAAVSELERRNSKPTTRDERSTNQLAVGTKVGVFVTLPFSTPAIKEGQQTTSQLNPEPQLRIADEPSFQHSIQLFQLENKFWESHSESNN